MKYKIGQELYRYYADDETGKVEMDTYVVRTIRGGVVYAINKNEFTWGKLSKKNGDFGWLDPIDKLFRKKTKQGEPFFKLFTTKRQALMDEMAFVKENKRDRFDDEIRTKIMSTMKGQLTKIKNSRSK